MERILSLTLILLLLFTACGRQKTSGDDGPNPDAQVTETQLQPDTEPVEEITAVSVPDTQEPPETEAPTSPKPTQESAKPTAVNPTQPTTLPEPSAEATTEQAPTTYTGTTITGAFIVKKVQGTLLTLHMYDPAKGGELKSGAYTADYGTLDGSDKMHFAVGDVVTIRYDQEIAETYPMQLTVREIYPAAWND